jgi:hypothetical protein
VPAHAIGQRTKLVEVGGLLHHATNTPWAVQVIATVPRGWRVTSSSGLR